MLSGKKPVKLCFSIPELESDTPTHHYHIYELLEEMGKQIQLFVVVDKPVVNRHVLRNVDQVYFTRFDFFPLRKIEQFLIFCNARLKGFKTFYIHYSLWNALITAFITKISGGKTFLWSCHEYKRKRLNEINSLAAIKKWVLGMVAVFAFKAVDFIVTGSISVTPNYIKEFHTTKDKFIVLPNWVNTDRFSFRYSPSKKNKDEEKNVTFIHSLTKERGASYLPFIIKKVINTVRGVNFTIIGDGLFKESIQDEIKKAGFQDRVKFVGYVPNKKIPKYLSSTDILILPSDNEGFPRVLIESMAMGVPFVATNVGGILEIVVPPQTECVVNKGDAEGFSQKVIDLLRNDGMREKLIKVGLERVKEYSLEKTVERFKEIIS